MPSATTAILRALGALSRRSSLALGVSALVGLGAFSVAPTARASSPYLEIPDPDVAMQTPAYRYANMSDDEAYAELDRRAILYSRVSNAPGVRAPIRLTGRLHGVLIRSALPPEERASSMFEICDARLALALDDFAQILERHDVEEVVHFTMYRPNVPLAESAPSTTAKVAMKGTGKVISAGKLMSAGAAKSAAGALGADKVGTGAFANDKTPPAAPSSPRTASPPDAAPERHAHSGKRRAFLDEKGTKSSKSHGSPLRGSGDSKHKEALVDDAESKALPSTFEASFEEPQPVDSVPSNSVPSKSGPSKSGPSTDLLAKVAPPAAKPATVAKPGGGAKPAPFKPGAPTAKSGKLPAKGALSKLGMKSEKGAAVAAFDDDLHGKWAPPGTRHPAGLAIDVGMLKKKNGKTLSVAAHFAGKLGDRTCGAGAPVPEAEEARELRSIVCEAHDAGVFTYTLTPNYNAAHRDHFHMEIKPGVVWFLYH